jgi:hypothetical protein
MNLNHYLCTYEALYLNSLVVGSRIGVIYGNISFTFTLWGDRSELLFSIVEPMRYNTQFMGATGGLGFKSTIRSRPGFIPSVEVLL